MNPGRVALVVTSAGLASAGQPSAQAVLRSKLLSVEAANAMVMGALAECQKNGY
jgi:hypothetical protein